jgi:urease accessory protein
MPNRLLIFVLALLLLAAGIVALALADHDSGGPLLTAAVHAQVSVAVRLVPLGQTAGLQVVAGLEPAVAVAATTAANAGLDGIGAIAYAADIAQMRHETIGTRVFRS